VLIYEFNENTNYIEANYSCVAYFEFVKKVTNHYINFR